MKTKYWYSQSKIITVFLIILLICSACKETEKLPNSNDLSTSDVSDHISNIKSVMELNFNGPDKEYIQLKQDIEPYSIDLSDEKLDELDKKNEQVNVYVKNKYKKYFTEIGIERFLNTFSHYHIPPGNYDLTLVALNINQSDNNKTPNLYDLTAQVELKKNSNKKIYEITGTANLSEKGLINEIRFLGDDENLLKKIANQN